MFLLASNLSTVWASPAELPRSPAPVLGNTSESVAAEAVASLGGRSCVSLLGLL